MPRRRTIVYNTWAAMLCAGLWTSAPANDSAPPSQRIELTGVRVGLAGKYKVGLWTPLTVTIRGGAQPAIGHLEVELLDGDDQWCLYRSDPARPIQTLPGQQSDASLVVRFGRAGSQARVRFVSEGKTLARRTFVGNDGAAADEFPSALASHEELWVNVGPSVGLPAAAKFLQRTQINRDITIAVLDDVAGLPTRWYGYEGVSAVVLATSQVEAWRSWTPQSASLTALREWVARGGRLLICAGSQIDEVLASQSSLAPFRPGNIEGSGPLRNYAALEQYVGASSPLPAPSANGETRLARITNVQGVVESREGDLPLVIRTPLGFGQVVFTPLDLDRPPFNQWSSQGEFLAKLLGQTTARGDTASAAANQQVNWLGITDLAGQLRGALDQFPGIRLIPFWFVAVLILGYVALIGPLDYLLVHKLLKRPELTWFTFPLMVLATCAGAYALAWRMKGDQLRVNQVDLVDCDVESGLVRGATWLNVFSPRPQTYDLKLKPIDTAGNDVADPEVLLTWFGLPGTAMGGLDGASAGPALWRRGYETTPSLDELHGVPIQVWASKSFAARWTHHEAPGLEATLSTDFEQAPRGKITNRTGLTLSDGLVAFDRWAIVLDKPLEPNQTVDLGAGAFELDRTELATRITNRRMIYDDAKKQFVSSAQTYDLQSFQTGDILRQMMFYQAVDGQQYTRLAHKYQQFVDLSGQLAAGRAIFVATGPAGGALLELNGQPPPAEVHRQETVYRFVIPVTPYQAKKP